MRSNDVVLRGSIGRALLHLAGPVILAEALHTAFHVVDVAWVGPLGAWATGAVMTSMFTLWFAFAVANLVTTGIGAHVSRAIGAGDLARARHVASQAVVLAVALGIPLAVVGWLGARPLFELLVDDARVVEAGTSYLRLIALGMPLFFASITSGAIMRACGNTRTPLVVTAAGLAVNAVLAPLLIYGPGPLPALGVAGSGLATLVAIAGCVGAYAVLGRRGHPDLIVDLADMARPRLATFLALARVGAPYCAVSMLFSLVYLWYARLAGLEGAAALAVLGIGNRLESVTYLSADGFGVAACTFVGQNLGAGQPQRAERGAWMAIGIMSAAGAAVGLAFALTPEPLLSIFTRDEEALALGVPYVRVLALCQVFTALEGAVGGAFAGAGDTLPPMLVHVTVALARLPLAAWAVNDMGMGLAGIAWTMTLTCVVRGLVLAAWFRRGGWKHVVLPDARPPLPAADSPEPVEIG